MVSARERLGGDLAPATADAAAGARSAESEVAAVRLARPRLRDLAGGAAALVAFTALGRESGHLQSLIPGTVAGFLLLTVALVVAERRPAWRRPVAAGVVPLAGLLLRHMGLLFAPVGVVGLQGLIDLPSRQAGPALLALVASTLLGLAATALVTGWGRA